MEPVFLKNSEEILYLISGKKDNLKGCLKEGYHLLDSSTAEGAGEKALFPSLGEAVRHLCGIIPAETGDQQPDNQPMLPVGASV